MAGKGDRMRKVNGPKYRDNYDFIYASKTDRSQDRPQSSNPYPETKNEQPEDRQTP